MSTTLRLPLEQVREVQDRAEQTGQTLEVVAARLLSQGLAAERDALSESSDPSQLARRRELTQKFVSGELGVALVGIDGSREKDRRKTSERADARCVAGEAR